MNGYNIPSQLPYSTDLRFLTGGMGFPAGAVPASAAAVPVAAVPQITPAQASSAVMPTGSLSTAPGMAAPVDPNAPVVPGTEGTGGAGTGFWDKIGGADGLGSLMKSLASLGSIYTGLQSLKVAKDEYRLNKEAYRTNLANTRMSFNTALEDRARSRFATEGRSQAEADAYVKKHSV